MARSLAEVGLAVEIYKQEVGACVPGCESVDVAGNGVFCFGAQVVDVEVDEVAGKVEVLEVWSAHDLGRAINPDRVEGQVQDSVVQGLGYALTEELVWDGGDLINPTMMDYKVQGSPMSRMAFTRSCWKTRNPGLPSGQGAWARWP